MHPFILIRQFDKREDQVKIEDLIKNYIMDGSKEAFLTCLFKEITLQLMILLCALLFIFFGLPPLLCLTAIPIVIFVIFFLVYAQHFNKAMELINERPMQCFVAELHYKGIEEPKDVSVVYSDCSQQNLDFIESNYMRKTIIGTVSIKMHISMDHSGWIYRFACSTPEFCKSAGPALLERVLKYSIGQSFYNVESVARECDEEYRELLLKTGFIMRQIYHKKIIGNSLRIMKAQFGIDLQKWSKSNA